MAKFKLKCGIPIGVVCIKEDLGPLNLIQTHTTDECILDDTKNAKYVSDQDSYIVIFDPPVKHPTYGMVYSWLVSKKYLIQIVEEKKVSQESINKQINDLFKIYTADLKQYVQWSEAETRRAAARVAHR